MRSSFHKSILKNGVTLLTEDLPHFQSLSIGIWVKSGTRHELIQESGLSHFLEHMIFKGTKKRSTLEIAQAVDQVGGEFNAFTAREHTCFHLLFLHKDLRLAIDILSDVLMNSVFLEEELEKERKVILQEISMVEENPEEYIHDVFFSQAYGAHPLGRPILGDSKTIKGFKKSHVLSFYRKHYTPSQMVIAVAGNVSHGKIKNLFNRYLNSQQSKKNNIRNLMNPIKPDRTSPKIHSGTRLIKRSLEQAHMVVGFPGVSYSHPDRFAFLLLNLYLGGGMSSSLFQEIRENRGLAYHLYSSLSSFSDSGLFSIYVATNPGEIKTCLKIVGHEIQKLKKSPLEKRSLKILKDNLKNTVLLNADSVENRMSTIAKNEIFYSRNYSIKDICGFIEKVKPLDLQRISNILFKPQNFILTVLGPINKAPSVKLVFNP